MNIKFPHRRKFLKKMHVSGYSIKPFLLNIQIFSFGIFRVEKSPSILLGRTSCETKFIMIKISTRIFSQIRLFALKIAL